MKTKGILVFGIALFSFVVISAQPVHVHGKHHGKVHKMNEKAYKEQVKWERKAYKEHLKREQKRQKRYAKQLRKNGYPVYYGQRYQTVTPYRRSPGIAIDGEVMFRNGSIRVGYYD